LPSHYLLSALGTCIQLLSELLSELLLELVFELLSFDFPAPKVLAFSFSLLLTSYSLLFTFSFLIFPPPCQSQGKKKKGPKILLDPGPLGFYLP
jgi:hypothetical protein